MNRSFAIPYPSRRFVIAFCLVLSLFPAFSLFAGGAREKDSGAPETILQGLRDIAVDPDSAAMERSRETGRMELRYAEGFSAEYHQGYTVVRVTRPWPGSTEQFTYILHQRGTPLPTGYEGYEDALVIDVPVRSFVALGSTYTASLVMLESVDTLTGVDRFGYVTSPRVWEMIDAGEVVQIVSGERPDWQLLLEMEPDLIMTSAVGNRWDVHPRLNELNLPVVINGEWAESHPLGRAEWIRFISLFYNKEEEAAELFSYIENQYMKLVSAASEQDGKPVVFCGAPFEGSWGAPAGDSYLARLISDAGGNYLWKDLEGTGTVRLSPEDAFRDISRGDVWINAGSGWKSFSDLLEADSRYAELKAVQNGAVYTNEKRVTAAGSNDYWETGVVVPSLILEDLVRIFHPGILPEKDFHFYDKLSW